MAARVRRVLMVNRPNALELPGGDTVQMYATKVALERMGIEVDVSLEREPDGIGRYDVLHVFNLQNPDIQYKQVQSLRKAGVPIALSTIFWDHKELDWADLVIRGASEQDPEQRDRLLEALARRDVEVNGQRWNTPVEGSDLYVEAQRQVARQVDLLLPNSHAEARNLFESLGIEPLPYRVVPNGIDVANFRDADPAPFIDKYGIQDFVFAASRWDCRKNLVLLAEALQGTGLPLVLAGSRPDPSYEALVRPLLPPGTIVLDHLDHNMLASAYAAARLHAQPSWFETPGLSSLEAALAGCSIVVGNRAAESEYFGDGAHYCDPASIAGIRQAILAAWHEHPTPAGAARRQALRDRILADYTWDKAAEATLAAYEALQENRGPILPRANITVRVPGGIPTVASGAANRPEDRMFAASIIIPCWNRADMTARCVQALAAHTPEELDYELIFVDNGSTDGTADLLADLEGDVRILRNPENLGFAKACNQGAEVARGDILVFLNNDTVPRPGWLEPLLETIRTVPRVGAAGSKLLLPDGRIQHAGVIVGSNTQALHWLYHQANPDPAVLDVPRDFQVVTAACLAVPKAVFGQVGGFDEGYRNGYEDVDLCFKIRKAGYRVRFVPRSVLLHEESASDGRFDHQDANFLLCVSRWKDTILPDLDRFEAIAEGRNPVFSVVVVTYNSAGTLDSCLGSVLLNLGPDDELIVVDNASQDRSVAIARGWAERDKRVWVHASTDNLGFSKGVNVGLRASEGEYLVLLNPDTIVTTGWLERMRAHFRGDAYASRVGAVGPLSNYVAGWQNVGEYLSHDRLRGASQEAVAAMLAAGGNSQGLETKLLIGFCMMVPRSVFEEVGLLDEDLFLGMDDLDLSWRIRNAGYTLGVATDAFVYHEGQVSFITKSEEWRRARTREACNAFARKLEAHYGRGRVPSQQTLFGIEWLDPDVDIWGPRPTVFRHEGDAWEQPLATYLAAFEPADPVKLELAPPAAEPLAEFAARVEQWLGTQGHDPDSIPDVELIPAGVTQDGRVLIGVPTPTSVSTASTAASVSTDSTPASVSTSSTTDRQVIPTPTPGSLREACGFRPDPVGKGLVSIVMLTRNAVHVTKHCLASIDHNTREPYELIVVDNGSTDETRSFLQGWARKRRNITLVFNDQNLGFAAGCNQGMAVARGEHILLLNNDVVVPDGWLTRMVRVLENDPAVGIVGPRSNRVASTQLIEGCTYQDLDEMHDFARDWSRQHAGLGHHDELAIGFAMLIRGEVFRQIGGLDTRFGTGNYEDDDYCLRAQLAGWKVWIADDCFIHHFGSETFKIEHGAGKLDYEDLITGNREIYFDKWMIRTETGRPGIASVLAAFEKQGRVYPPEYLRVDLPAAREVKLAVTEIGIDGAGVANLLLWPDWDESGWQEVVREFARAFDGQSGVALVLPAPPHDALGQVVDLLEGDEGKDSPDVLVVPQACWAGDLVASTQGVVLAGHGRDAELRHLAGLLGKPVLEGPEVGGLREWAGTPAAPGLSRPAPCSP